MGRAPCCDKANVKKGPWSPEEDAKLKDFIHKFGTGGNWIALPHKAGLKRCGKSCRLRWLNYLRPNIKHGEFSDEEDRIICSIYATIGSRWSVIAAQLPGRTDNDIKNYWNTKLKKKLINVMLSNNNTNNNQASSNQQKSTSSSLLFQSSSSSTTPTALQAPSAPQELTFYTNTPQNSSFSGFSDQPYSCSSFQSHDHQGFFNLTHFGSEINSSDINLATFGGTSEACGSSSYSGTKPDIKEEEADGDHNQQKLLNTCLEPTYGQFGNNNNSSCGFEEGQLSQGHKVLLQYAGAASASVDHHHYQLPNSEGYFGNSCISFNNDCLENVRKIDSRIDETEMMRYYYHY
ncbi:unnamed protein product [Cuscuta epithymum]|uniref:Uncharacterized protein n=1 Tax=Cuscuta epithymum TaxID=186058 RepID=A0AAV0EKF5_9ASTE|nr:unnamed protein product [Cuscuta epithymum]